MAEARPPRTGERGFALIGLVGLLLIVGALGLYVFSRSAEEENLRIEAELQDQLQTVRTALLAYALSVTGTTPAFPCPDTTDDGSAEATCTEPAEGTVPYRDLGLQKAGVIDGWHRPLRYAASLTGGLTVTDNGAAQAGMNYVLFSLGPNGPNGNTTEEQENQDGDAAFAAAPVVDGGFDDRLLWGVAPGTEPRTAAEVSWPANIDSFVASGDSDTNKANPALDPVIIDKTDPANPVVQMDGSTGGGNTRSCFYGPSRVAIGWSILRTYFEVSFAEDLEADNARGDGLVFLLLPKTAKNAFGATATTAADLQCGDAAHLGYYGATSGDASGAAALSGYKIGVEIDTKPDTGSATVFDPTSNHVAILRQTEQHAGIETNGFFDGPACTTTQQAVADLDRDAPPVHACWDPGTLTWLEEGHANWSKVRIEVRHLGTDAAATAAGCTAPSPGHPDAVRVDAWIWSPATACTDCDDLTKDVTNDATTHIWHCVPYDAINQETMWYGFTQASTGAAGGVANSQPWIRGFKLRNETP